MFRSNLHQLSSRKLEYDLVLVDRLHADDLLPLYLTPAHLASLLRALLWVRYVLDQYPLLLDRFERLPRNRSLRECCRSATARLAIKTPAYTRRPDNEPQNSGRLAAKL